jgi:5-methylcytosine-specific restriction endonuclease McrA
LVLLHADEDFFAPETAHDQSTYCVWQRRFYDFNVWSEEKRLEKLDYMHGNPVQRALVKSSRLLNRMRRHAYTACLRHPANMANEINSKTLRNRLIALRQLRAKAKDWNRGNPRQRLTAAERATVLQKTGGKCHICGGKIEGRWHADHVLAHSAGGGHAADNYLPAHATCNNYRWDYVAEEFEVILKLGVWARTQIERGTNVGREIEAQFSRHEKSRMGRRKMVTSRGGAEMRREHVY